MPFGAAFGNFTLIYVAAVLVLLFLGAAGPADCGATGPARHAGRRSGSGRQARGDGFWD